MANDTQPEADHAVGAYLPARRVAELLKITVAEVESIAERYGVRVVRIIGRGHRPKLRIEVAGLQRAIEEMGRRPVRQADRVELAVAQTLERFGLNRKERPR
ncbi:MAG: hypothetical protein IT458_15725 [Planctomycetes bacterium]|nr:hypothetical protein [Planctomycetota bacterium]